MKTLGSERHWPGATVVGMVTAMALAGHLGAQDCQIFQLTEGENYDFMPVTGISSSADGSRVVFRSTSDWSGLNPDHSWELFLFDRRTGLSRITSNDPTWSPSSDLSEDGRTVVYSLNHDPLGTNPDGNFELFLVDLDSMVTVALTDTIGVDHYDPKISADGSLVAFRSNDDPVGQNPDGSFEIFRLDIPSSSLSQITSVTGPVSLSELDLSADGSTIAFESAWDFVTGGNPDGNTELFLHRQGLGFIQVTDTTDVSHGTSQRLTSDGTRVFFVDDADLVGSNPDGNGEMYRFDVVGGLTQITDTEEYSAAEVFSVSGDGSRIALDSQIDYLGPGPSGGVWGVYHYEVATGQISIAGERDLSAVPEISGMGNAVAFWSWSDLTGGNPGHEFQLFQAECYPLFADGFETGDTQAWGQSLP